MKVWITAKYVNEAVNLSFGEYGDGSTSIEGFSLDWEPLFKATVALDKKPAKGYVFLKGWSENEGIPEALEKSGIVRLNGCTVPTGFCEAQEARLLVKPD